jgi:hypothetical protein
MTDLLGVVRPAIPGWNLLLKPQCTDESGCTSLSSITLCSRCLNAPLCHCGEASVQLDAAPLAS